MGMREGRESEQGKRRKGGQWKKKKKDRGWKDGREGLRNSMEA